MTDKLEQNQQDELQPLCDLAAAIVKRGMAVPAIFFLEMNKPVSFLGAQALVFFGPIVTAFVNESKYYNLAKLLEERKNVEFLLREIERLEQAEKEREKADL